MKSRTSQVGLCCYLRPGVKTKESSTSAPVPQVSFCCRRQSPSLAALSAFPISSLFLFSPPGLN